MREISAEKITEVVRRLCIEANCHLPSDVKTAIETAYEGEPWGQAREILEAGDDLPPQTEGFIRGFSGRDGLELARTLAPMEKWKRDQLIDILQSWLELSELALAARTGGSPAPSLARSLSESRSSLELMGLIRHLNKALSYARSNVAPAAVCGYLSWALRGSYD